MYISTYLKICSIVCCIILLFVLTSLEYVYLYMESIKDQILILNNKKTIDYIHIYDFFKTK
jgi:hypothetical protein